MENNLKQIALHNNLTGKLMETVDLLAKIKSEEELDELLDLAKKAYKVNKKHPENKKYIYFDVDEAKWLVPVSSWEYKKEEK